ncbi:DUF1104 domain-containing protein [Sulfurospirillum barnesii]|uniref:Uncharacterized protein n=1 Tax=Sulfurospirillum barnesii (strain ATCC 700032 / DSM 10660 / SES-3) TaxID=760154 RepID=I3XU17_SULBS|nr:DUF1104 domain-containing protein [Sulfurospirillum barnesii]AFL67441.1 Protein of unknown function (DUF1104) [Sulfurospirillum barnesii SES-3]
MQKALFILLLFLGVLFAKADFSEMSTEELIALIGYVEPHKEERFFKELQRREAQMSEEQKALYESQKQKRDSGEK